MKKFILIVTVAVISLVACKKNEMDNQQPMLKAIAGDFGDQPYTYLQNKYIDLVLAYELKKQETKYYPENFSYEDKLEMILLLDSIKNRETRGETKEDVYFHENLEKELMAEINNHPYVKRFVRSFSLKENYDENDIMIYTGYSDCEDRISKFQILQYYEDGIDIISHYSERNGLTGDEEWSLYPAENSKGVRYKLHSKWGNTIEYMWNGTAATVKANVLLAMADWKVAANNKISFSEITTNVNWNKTCWIMGWKYFLRINSVTSGNFGGYSTLGKVPWADMVININKSSYPRTYRHELGHTLGLAHEHKRPDRDNHITYKSSNVQAGMESQFTKLPAGSYDYHSSTFDFNSIMLYGSFAYSKKGDTGNSADATLLKKDGTIFYVSSAISATDQNVIRKIYN